MSRTNIELDDALVLRARKLTRLKTKREIVHSALKLLVCSETRKGVLRFYGSGVWKGDAEKPRLILFERRRLWSAAALLPLSQR